MMKPLLAICVMASLGLALPAFAQAPVTATCKDGTAFSGNSRSGACRGHGGVQTWGTNAAPAATSSAPAATTSSQTQSPPPSTPAAGVAAGQVWVNTASKVYHCPGDRYYGNTKQGTYMSEAAAKAAGDRPSNGKVCS
jgi:hypothetical protein